MKKIMSIFLAALLFLSFAPEDDEKELNRDQQKYIQNVVYKILDFPEEELTENEEELIYVHFHVFQGKMIIDKVISEIPEIADQVTDQLQNMELSDEIPNSKKYVMPINFKKE
jgi:hypothetical protein